MIELVVYVTEEGKAPFDDWFDKLDTIAALKVRTALARVETGNLGDVKPVGQGVSERRHLLWPRLSCLFWQGRRQTRDPALRRNEEAPVKGHRASKGVLGRLQEPKKERRLTCH